MLTTTQWMNLRADTRDKLRDILKIKRSSHTWVRDNQLVSDGTTQEDLNALTIETLKEFVGCEDNIDNLFLKAIDLVEHNVIMAEPTTIGQDKAPQTLETPIQTEVAPEVVVSYKCEVCNKEYKQEKSFTKHKKSHA